MEIPSFNALIQKSIIDHWDMDALTDYKGATLQFHDVARKIEKLHIMFENSGVVKGDKIALCGRNSANWAVAFLATLTYGAVAVPILHEFMPEQIHNIVNHSDAKLLFVGDVVATQIDATKMPGLEGIIYPTILWWYHVPTNSPMHASISTRCSVSSSLSISARNTYIIILRRTQTR